VYEDIKCIECGDEQDSDFIESIKEINQVRGKNLAIEPFGRCIYNRESAGT
jgi:hypothetical protein